MGKIIIHAVGGAGINVADKVVNNVADLGSGFAEIVFNYLDTSRANIDKISPRGKFYQVSKAKLTDAEVSGRGGERATEIASLKLFIPKYLDETGYKEKVTGEYHVVIFSASGATGSVMGPLLLKRLLEFGIPTVSVVIGDTSNALFSINTMDTLATLNNIAVKANKPLSVIYANNASQKGEGLLDSENKANEFLFSTLSALSVFLSGQNGELDDRDLEGLIDQSMYSRLHIVPGLYGMRMFQGKIAMPEGTYPTVVRSLKIGDQDCTLGIELLHHKVGYITDPNAIEIFKKQSPIHIVNYSNFFATEARDLERIVKKYQEVIGGVSNQTVMGSAGSTADDDGLVL